MNNKWKRRKRSSEEDGLKETISNSGLSLQEERKYPSFNVLVNPMFACISSENFSTALPPLRNLTEENVLPAPVGVGNNIQQPSSYNNDVANSQEAAIPNMGFSLNTDENNNFIDPPENNSHHDHLVHEYEDITEDPDLRSMVHYILAGTFTDVYIERNIRWPRDDPDEGTDFLCKNRLVASFLAAITTIGGMENMGSRIIKHFPTLIPEVISDPEEELNRFSKVFERQDFFNLATAFLDQFEETGIFDGRHCSVEKEILVMAELALARM